VVVLVYIPTSSVKRVPFSPASSRTPVGGGVADDGCSNSPPTFLDPGYV
jgi:hypothetical protein